MSLTATDCSDNALCLTALSGILRVFCRNLASQPLQRLAFYYIRAQHCVTIPLIDVECVMLSVTRAQPQRTNLQPSPHPFQLLKHNEATPGRVEAVGIGCLFA